MQVQRIILFLTFVSVLSTAQIQQDSSSTADSLLAIELQSQLHPSTTMPAASIRTAPTTNPDISAIGDFRSLYTTEGSRNVEAYFNALEVQFTSVVDPYARANFIFAFDKDSLNGDYGAGLEIATLTSLSLPYSLQVTLGKFKPHFTKVNLLHPHAFSFVEFPTMIGNYFDGEGLFMQGISASVLVPNPWDFYQEFTFEAGRSETNASLDNGIDNSLLYVAHLDNFFELSDNSTLNIGLSGLRGPNALDLATTMAGFDLTYKWKPVQYNTYHSFTWQTEGLISYSDTTAGQGVRTFGGYSFIEYQIEKRTFAGTRFDYSGLPGLRKAGERRISLLLRFQPSEYQILALEFQNINRNFAPSFQQIVFRAIFGIGAHAAHPY
ncbi:MAG: hypothetical protein HYV29_09980 [Ignavibacteriales bacterium]|nr:hypothetical protein [Ignavibacteriales bacterium]